MPNIFYVEFNKNIEILMQDKDIALKEESPGTNGKTVESKFQIYKKYYQDCENLILEEQHKIFKMIQSSVCEVSTKEGKEITALQDIVQTWEVLAQQTA